MQEGAVNEPTRLQSARVGSVSIGKRMTTGVASLLLAFQERAWWTASLAPRKPWVPSSDLHKSNVVGHTCNPVA